ncbi:MAG: hypothetical protein WCR79_05415 [Fusobacterium sp.]
MIEKIIKVGAGITIITLMGINHIDRNNYERRTIVREERFYKELTISRKEYVDSLHQIVEPLKSVNDRLEKIEYKLKSLG